MKKVLLSLSVLFSAGAFAQNVASPADLNMHSIDVKEQTIVDQAKARIRNANNLSKKAGGPVSQYMSHAEVMENLLGSKLTNYISPIFQDTTVVQDFGQLEYVQYSAYGSIFNVYSQAFAFEGLDSFAVVDDYTVDSVLIGGFYDLVNNKSTSPTGDSLIIDVVWGDPVNTTGGPFGTINWPAGTWSDQTSIYPCAAIRFTGDPAQGYAGDVTWPNKVTFKKALTPADTVNGYHSIYTNLQIPAGEVLGVTVRFKTGEAYNSGDVYFAGANSTSTAVLNSFRVLTTGSASSSDNKAYFFEDIALGVPKSYAGSGPVFPTSRYGSSGGSFVTQGGGTADWWIHVSGNSTIGLAEQNVDNNIALYPNPTSGNVTLEIAQGGTYTIDVLNLVGQVVYSEQVSINGGEKLNRDFSNLTKGVYLINLNGEGISKTSKLTIK